MSKVYLAIPHASDRLLGHVTEDGKIFRSQIGPDDEIGHVSLSTGQIYEKRFGLDKKIGYVDPSNGKVYLNRLGPDEYTGQATTDGSLYRHVPMSADDYVGKVERFVSYAHSAGALLLLVLPAIEARKEDETAE
jgi:hypothetical protein